MAWFKRTREGITTATEEKLEVPEGIWWNCPNCKKTISTDELKGNFYVCTNCDYHPRINSVEYFELLFDDNKYELIFENLKPEDFLHFKDLKSYEDRLKETFSKVDV